VTSSLKLFAQWIIKISESESEDKKKKVLLHLMPLLETANPSEQLLSKSAIPSVFLINAAMKLHNSNINLPIEELNVNDYKNFGEQLGNSIWNSRKELKQNLSILENPTSLNQYYN